MSPANVLATMCRSFTIEPDPESPTYLRYPGLARPWAFQGRLWATDGQILASCDLADAGVAEEDWQPAGRVPPNPGGVVPPMLSMTHDRVNFEEFVADDPAAISARHVAALRRLKVADIWIPSADCTSATTVAVCMAGPIMIVLICKVSQRAKGGQP